jgi:ionotropic glutamate receptor
VVGDITIIANRSNFVDFTLPYTESGVSMVVPVKDNRSKNAWVFLKPLTWDLWMTSGCFFVFIGFVVWVLEHRINDDFRGPPSHQIGTSLWYAFSTMVFAHRKFHLPCSNLFLYNSNKQFKYTIQGLCTIYHVQTLVCLL